MVLNMKKPYHGRTGTCGGARLTGSGCRLDCSDDVFINNPSFSAVAWEAKSEPDAGTTVPYAGAETATLMGPEDDVGSPVRLEKCHHLDLLTTSAA